MDTIFMNSTNSKISDPHRLLISLTNIINLKVHYCRFENLLVCSYSYKNYTLKISHS